MPTSDRCYLTSGRLTSGRYLTLDPWSPDPTPTPGVDPHTLFPERPPSRFWDPDSVTPGRTCEDALCDCDRCTVAFGPSRHDRTCLCPECLLLRLDSLALIDSPRIDRQRGTVVRSVGLDFWVPPFEVPRGLRRGSVRLTITWDDGPRVHSWTSRWMPYLGWDEYGSGGTIVTPSGRWGLGNLAEMRENHVSVSWTSDRVEPTDGGLCGGLCGCDRGCRNASVQAVLPGRMSYEGASVGSVVLHNETGRSCWAWFLDRNGVALSQRPVWVDVGEVSQDHVSEATVQNADTSYDLEDWPRTWVPIADLLAALPAHGVATATGVAYGDTMPTTTVSATAEQVAPGEVPPVPGAVVGGSNASEAACARCGTTVPPRAGVNWRMPPGASRRWVATHLTGACPGETPPAPAPKPKSKLAARTDKARDLLKQTMVLLGCDEEAALDMTAGLTDEQIDLVLTMDRQRATTFLTTGVDPAVVPF